MSFINSIILGLLTNALYDSVKCCTKKVFTDREMDFELRRAVSQIQEKQINTEGLINRLVDNQEYMISLILSVLKQYDLKSKVYLDNNHYIFVPNEDDLSVIKLLSSGEKDIRNNEPTMFPNKLDRFSSYYTYVKKKRGEI